MSLNTGFFAAFNQRHKRTTIVQRVPLKHPPTSYLKSARSSSVESSCGKESFLPVISTVNGKQEGHRPYRRNDFANNHVFVAKYKLARLFSDQSSSKNLPVSKSELTPLLGQHTPKQKTQRVNNNKRQVKIISRIGIVNLTLLFRRAIPMLNRRHHSIPMYICRW